jgi:cell division protein FtsB
MAAATRRRGWGWILVGCGALWFSVQGGEYSTVDLVRQRAREASLRRTVDSLQQEVDSLAALRAQVRNDPRVQERIARERYGMVRGEKEILYRFIDSTTRKP